MGKQSKASQAAKQRRAEKRLLERQDREQHQITPPRGDRGTGTGGQRSDSSGVEEAQEVQTHNILDALDAHHATHHDLSTPPRETAITCRGTIITSPDHGQIPWWRCSYPVSPGNIVLLTTVAEEQRRKGWSRKHRSNRSTKKGSQRDTGAKEAQPHTGQLGIDLGGRPRLPKPRKVREIDEIEWARATQTAYEQVVKEFGIKVELEMYYSTMCEVGQKLMAEDLHRRCQCIYDFRVGHKIYRANRKKKAA